MSIDSNLSGDLPVNLQANSGGVGGRAGSAGTTAEPHVNAPEVTHPEPGNDGHQGLDGFACRHYEVTTGGGSISERELDPGNCLDLS